MSPTNDSDDIEPHLAELSWNEILYDDGLAARVTGSSFRSITIGVCLIGIIGNILAVCTLLRRRMRTLSTYIYLTALCLSNIVALVSVIMFEGEMFFVPTRQNCSIVLTAKALASSTFALSTWITVGFTVDRYVMICFPFTGKNRCTRRNAIYVILICLLFAISYFIPQLFAQKCHPLIQYLPTDMNASANVSLLQHNYIETPVYWVTGLSDHGKSAVFRVVATLFANCLLIRIVPFLVISILNFHLVKTLSETKRRHREMNPFEQNRNDVTYMLVVVISTYLLCIIPSIPFAAFFAYDPHQYIDISVHYIIFQHLDEFTKFLIILNSASQCYLYIFFGKRFRRELSSFLCLCCIRHCHMSIPQSYLSDECELFNGDVWSANEAYELALEGEWVANRQHDGLAGIEFSFHYVRRTSRLPSTTGISLLADSDERYKRFSNSLLKSFRKSS
ncbi:unnamed protein product [Adineta ricciae]|uniref:G-protein coupled receptors family 1 profile domain-containing protein n=1 Tax=Adineta ricciae TaxID=249248 RepID=A0A815YUJ1_ADIRI|nr:unnamed protein product [Adineta ricciae]